MMMKIKFIGELIEPYDLMVRIVNKEQIDRINNSIVTKAIHNDNWSVESPSPLYIASERLLLIGLTKDGYNIHEIAKKLYCFVDKKSRSFTKITIDMVYHENLVNVFLKAIFQHYYTFEKYKTIVAHEVHEYSIVVSDPFGVKNRFKGTSDIIEAIYIAKDLSNEPSNILTTKTFIEYIKEMKHDGLQIDVLDQKLLGKIGANLIASVGKGSINPPYMAILTYKGRVNTGTYDIAFVGKGICFDSGGLCIKSSNGMREMKHDMSGAAALFVVMNYLAKRKYKINAVCVLGIAENIPSSSSYKPGDIICSYSGDYVEIIDTDAEGRLVLADCISYVKKSFSPNVIIDIATLTGSVKGALGSTYAGLFSNSPDLIEMLKHCGKESGNKLWELPLGEEYSSYNNSRWADISNVGNRNGCVIKECGASVAAEFIRFFVKETPWAHIDIGGTAYDQNGATGFGVELLITYLNCLSQQEMP